MKTLLSVARPGWFVPVHGEYRHLIAHASIARAMGVADHQVIVCEDGDSIVVDDSGIRPGPGRPAGYQYVDGIANDVGPSVLRDRTTLAEDGVVVVIVMIDASTGRVLSGPEIVTRGWVHAATSTELLNAACDHISAAVEDAFAHRVRDPIALEGALRRVVSKFVAEKTGRRPIIVPVVMEA